MTTLRLAEYRGGVFYRYVNIASVRISKGGQYYGSDLSKGGSSTEPAAIGSGSEIPISAVSLNGNVVTKAQTGTYLLELKFYPSDGQSTSLATTTGYLEVTDSQANPVISVDRTVSTVNCKTALDLAKNCLSIQGMDGGVIADCTVTGSSVPGASYSVADLRKKNGHEEPWTIDYFGVGNENWGCGGNMRPQYYADEYRRYQTYVRNYDPQKPIQKICGGANVDDYDWTRKVLETTHDHTVPEFHGFMDGLSLHYYVHPEGWEIKGSATDFDEEVWYKTLKKALYMETLVERHGKIMDQYDPDKKIGMIVDEWGCWFTVEPGTNPGFLYQQNTVRDALVAGITLNIFNKHCDRVKMANLAQMVNVLQSVILTEGPKMIKTPTYHVFHMYRHHQGATLLNSTLTGVGETGIGEWKVPEVTESVSEDAEHIITVTLNNLSADEEKEIEIAFAGDEHVYSVKEAKVVSAEMHAHNTFDVPELVKEEEFTAYKKCGNGIKVMLPPCSVVELRLQ